MTMPNDPEYMLGTCVLINNHLKEQESFCYPFNQEDQGGPRRSVYTTL